MRARSGNAASLEFYVFFANFSLFSNLQQEVREDILHPKERSKEDKDKIGGCFLYREDYFECL